MTARSEPDQGDLLKASVESVLSCLPEKIVPSRGFVTICSELALALTDAWLAAYIAGGSPALSAPSSQGRDGEASAALRSQLASEVGPACAQAWWGDTAEQVERTSADAIRARTPRPPTEVIVAPGGASQADGSSGSSTRATTPTPTSTLVGVPWRGHGASGSQGALKVLLMELMRDSLAFAMRGATAADPGGGRAPSFGGYGGLPALEEEDEDGESSDSRLDRARESWLSFGASWVLCALDDVIGSVVAHHRRKSVKPPSASAAAARPGSRGGARPGSSAGGVGAFRPASRGGERPPSSAGVQAPTGRARPGTGEARPKTPAGALPLEQTRLDAPPERRRLLALKHFVAAVKADKDLQACTILETCLVEVATGVLPHVEPSQLLAMQAYNERLLLWAEQEADAEGSVELAMTQAMKGVSAANATPRAIKSPQVNSSSAGRSGSAAASRPAAKAPLPAAPASRAAPAAPRAGGGWLPKTFIKEFNAEGDEVEPEHDEVPEEDEVPEGLDGLAQFSVKAKVVFSEQEVSFM